MEGLKKKSEKKEQKVQEYEISSVKVPDADLSLLAVHKDKIYSLPVLEGLKVTWERKNAPGKLTFTTLQDKNKKLYNGDAIMMKISGREFFMGFIFSLTPQKEGTLDVVAYDQLRYFKNKDTYAYQSKTTTQLVQMIAKDFGLRTGKLDNTKKPFSRVEEDMTLFDIVENSLSDTLSSTGKIYTLYDEYGKLRLREPWKVNILLDEETAQDYSYSLSIDDEVYNQIKLVYQDDKTKAQMTYMKNDLKTIEKWGILQYFEKIDNPQEAKLKAQTLLKLYNKVSRTLKISGAFGPIRYGQAACCRYR